MTEDLIFHSRHGIGDTPPHSVSVRDVSGVSLRHRPVFRPWLFVVPLAILVILGNWASEFPVEVAENESSAIHKDDIINLSLLLAFATIPLPLVAPGMVLRITAADEAIRCRIPKRHHEDARRFIQRLVALRIHEEGRLERTDKSIPTPTTSPFGQ